MENEIALKKPDTLETIEQDDVLQLTRNLLDATVKATDMLNITEFTPEKLKEAKMVLGYINAVRGLMTTKLQVFKMTGINEKVKIIREVSKQLK